MTFVGKMLIVLQLVLSLLFMAFAGAVSTVEKNWKQESSNIQDELKVEQESYTCLLYTSPSPRDA